MDEVVWRYVGSGAWVNGVPARDLTEGDVEALAQREGIGEDVIGGCGLYELVEEPGWGVAVPGDPGEEPGWGLAVPDDPTADTR